MKKIFIYFLIFVTAFSLTGCSNDELSELRMKQDIENNKVESIISEYNLNIKLFNTIENELISYLFEKDKDVYDFDNYKSVFYNEDGIIPLYFARERMYTYVRKYELNTESLEAELKYYPFMNEETGGVEVYYTLPIDIYAKMEMIIKIQEGQIISVEYDIQNGI